MMRMAEKQHYSELAMLWATNLMIFSSILFQIWQQRFLSKNFHRLILLIFLSLLNSIYLSEVTSELISNFLKCLKHGYDEIKASLLKYISSFITESFKHLSNLSLSLNDGDFPTESKLAYVHHINQSLDGLAAEDR